jgi:hypothetical protein
MRHVGITEKYFLSHVAAAHNGRFGLSHTQSGHWLPCPDGAWFLQWYGLLRPPFGSRPRFTAAGEACAFAVEFHGALADCEVGGRLDLVHERRRLGVCPTGLSGSSSGWFSNQASRRLRTSGRFCLAACAVYAPQSASNGDLLLGAWLQVSGSCERLEPSGSRWRRLPRTAPPLPGTKSPSRALTPRGYEDHGISNSPCMPATLHPHAV